MSRRTQPPVNGPSPTWPNQPPLSSRAAVDAEAAQTPTGRICTPKDVASAAAYLGSAANGYTNGEVLSVAGGRHLTR